MFQFGTVRCHFGVVAAGDESSPSSEDPDPNYAKSCFRRWSELLASCKQEDSMVHWNLRGGFCCGSFIKENSAEGQIVIAISPGAGQVVKRLTVTANGVPHVRKPTLTARFLYEGVQLARDCGSLGAGNGLMQLPKARRNEATGRWRHIQIKPFSQTRRS